MGERVPVPRDRENDYTRDAAAGARAFAQERTGASLEHVSSYSFDPAILTGNVETSSASRRCRSASPGRCSSTASTRRASSTCRSRPRRARSSRATTAACACSRSGRRHDDDPRRPHAARAGLPLRERTRGARLRRTGSTSTSRRSSARPRPRPAPAGSRTSSSTGGPDALHALQLHDRRRRGPEPDRQGNPRGVQVDSREPPGHRAATSSSRTSRRTRRARR